MGTRIPGHPWTPLKQAPDNRNVDSNFGPHKQAASFQAGCAYDSVAAPPSYSTGGWGGRTPLDFFDNP